MRTYVFKARWKRTLARLWDAIGACLFFFIRRNFKISNSSVKKILLARIDHMGDALLLRPVISQLRQTQPDLLIHVLTTPENTPIFLLDPFLDRIVPFPDHWFQKGVTFFRAFRSSWKIIRQLRREHYDAAVDFRGDVRMNLILFLAGIPIRIGYGITGGGWMLTHEHPWNATEHQIILNQKLLAPWIPVEANLKNPAVHYPASTYAQLKEKISGVEWPYAVVHMGAGNPQKEWPSENFSDLMSRLLQSGFVKNFFLIGTDTEKRRNPAPARPGIMDLRGATDLHELTCLLDGAAFFIGNDSGPAHLAAAQGIPTVVLASATNDINAWHPWTKKLCVLPPPPGKTVPLAQAEAAVFSLLSQG